MGPPRNRHVTATKPPRNRHRYEFGFEFEEWDRVDTASYDFSVDQLQANEWLAFRSAPWVQQPDHLVVSTSSGGTKYTPFDRLPIPTLDAPYYAVASAFAAPPPPDVEEGDNRTDAGWSERHRYAASLCNGTALFDAAGRDTALLNGGARLQTGSNMTAELAAGVQTAVVFDGSAAAGGVSLSPELAGYPDVTVELWASTSMYVGEARGALLDLSGGIQLYDADPSSSNAHLTLKFPTSSSGVATIRDSKALPSGMHCITAVLGRRGGYLYLDGVQVAQTSNTFLPLVSDGPGSMFANVRGEFYSLRLFNASFNASEVASRFAAMLPLVPAASSDWYTDVNGTESSTFLVKDAPRCSYQWWDTCLEELGEYEEKPCPESDPGCQLSPISGRVGDADWKLWSDPATWNGTVPELGQNVTIERGMYVLLDVSPPMLHGISIRGSLDVLSNGSALSLRALYIVVRDGANFTAGGNLVNGSIAPFNGTFEIALSGDRYTSGPRFNQRNHGAKCMLVFGNLRMQARVPTPVWTRLNSTAPANAAELVVLGLVDWSVGDDIVIASTDYEPGHAEERTITHVEAVVGADGVEASVVGLSAPLLFSHFAGAEEHGGHLVEMRAEVGHLSRDIVVRGTDIDEDPRFRSLWNGETGVQVIVGGYRQFYGTSFVTEEGSAQLIGVRIDRGGVNGYDDRPALGFIGLTRSAEPSMLAGCVVSHSYNVGLQLGTPFEPGPAMVGLLTAVDNVVFNTLGSNVRDHVGGNSFVGNLALSAVTRLTYRGRESRSTLLNVEWEDYCANFEVLRGVGVFSSNAAAGSERIGLKFSATPSKCDGTGAVFANNTAHSSLLCMAVHKSPSETCVEIGNLTVFRCWSYGLWGNTQYDTLRVAQLTVADSKVGFYWGLAGPPGASHQLKDPPKAIELTDSLVLGRSVGNPECSQECIDGGGTFAGCIGRPVHTDNWAWGATRAQAGLLLPAFASGVNGAIPKKKPWHKTQVSYPSLANEVKVSRVTFASFAESPCNVQSVVLESNDLIPDAYFPFFFSQITLDAIAPSAQLIDLHPPSRGWIQISDCVTMDCDGPKHIQILDVDGSLTGNGAGASVLARAEFQNPFRADGVTPTGYRIPAKMQWDGHPVSRRLQEDPSPAPDAQANPGRVLIADAAAATSKLASLAQLKAFVMDTILAPLRALFLPDARDNSLVGTKRRGLQTATAAPTAAPTASTSTLCDPSWALNDPACTAVFRTPEEIAFNGYGTYRAGCELMPTWNAWLCNSSSIDPAQLIIESLDADTETRSLVPVALASAGYVDIMNGGQDHGWCFGYTCLKRLSTFFSTVALGHAYDLAFSGTNPKRLRLAMPTAPASSKVSCRFERGGSWPGGLGRAGRLGA